MLVAILVVLVVVVAVVAGGSRPSGSSGATPSSTPSPSLAASPSSSPTPGAIPTAIGSACLPTDQDAYVYNPSRLIVLAPCIRVTGVVEDIRAESDGDLHILLVLDPPYVALLRPANQGEELGDLVVEPVCVRPVKQRDAIATCRGDPDPLAAPLPVIGQAVWMEGRSVFDSEHGDWAELHPLYRWGPLGD